MEWAKRTSDLYSFTKKIVREPKEELKLDPKNQNPKNQDQNELFLYSPPTEEGIKLEPTIAGMEELQIVSQELEQKMMMACTKPIEQNEDTMTKPAALFKHICPII